MDVFAKLNFKDPKNVLIANCPDSFEAEVRKLGRRDLHEALTEAQSIDFALIFVTRVAEVSKLAGSLASKAPGDAVVWFAYPKGSSKKLRSDIKRDAGWEPLLALGFETVRLIAIDEDWSALRFRRSQFVKARASK